MTSKIYILKDSIAEATSCTFQEFKNKYSIQSDQYNDLERGYAVRYALRYSVRMLNMDSNNIIFVPSYI